MSLQQLVQDYKRAGITDIPQMLDLESKGITAEDAIQYANAGFNGNTVAMIELNEKKISGREARLYSNSGFEGELQAIITLKSIFDKDYELLSIYRKAGFEGKQNIENIVLLHNSGIETAGHNGKAIRLLVEHGQQDISDPDITKATQKMIEIHQQLSKIEHYWTYEFEKIAMKLTNLHPENKEPITYLELHLSKRKKVDYELNYAEFRRDIKATHIALLMQYDWGEQELKTKLKKIETERRKSLHEQNNKDIPYEKRLDNNDFLVMESDAHKIADKQLLIAYHLLKKDKIEEFKRKYERV